MPRSAPIDGPAEPQNLHSVPDRYWAEFDIAQRIIFNSTFSDVHAALHDPGIHSCLRDLDSAQRFNVAWTAAWKVAVHLGAANDLRAALLHDAEFRRINPPPRKEIG